MKMKSGFRRLDAMLGGGLPAGTNILLSGGPGTGKTLFSLKFLLEGLKAGEKCCYITLSENRDELLRAAENIESLKDIRNHLSRKLAIEHIELGENITMKRFNEVISSYPAIDRLVIDNINKLLIHTESKKSYRIHLAELLKHLKSISRCTLLICETSEDSIDTGNGEAFECDGVMQLSFLEFEEKPMRILQIHKLRYTSFEPKTPHELTISAKDLNLADTKII
ncbi:MAG: DUF2075 domain-containing protein [Candidatus Aenigmarchaeota archaeon]|nr:DUF2075 domain-containing protein [Candidatus Aenigmarchaeota archaeon]